MYIKQVLKILALQNFCRQKWLSSLCQYLPLERKAVGKPK